MRPLGLVQKGRSRTWLDDQSFWVGVVEFQPSAWERGSYLNVGACWLWYEKDFLSFDAGDYRIEGFASYDSDEQFASAVQGLAARAGEGVQKLRRRFPSPAHVQAELIARPPRSIWDHYHLAVSSGLAGDKDQSRRSFADVMSNPDERSWTMEVRRRAAELMRCLELGSGFEAEVMDTIRRMRGLLKLSDRTELVRTSL